MPFPTRARARARLKAPPPPRRKSCAACIRGKRRCDLAVPACLRCSQRQIACQYPDRRAVGAQSAVAGMASPAQFTMEELLALDALDFDDMFGGATAPAETDANLDQAMALHLHSPLSSSMEMLDPAGKSPTLALSYSKAADCHASTSQQMKDRMQWSLDEIRKAPSTMVLETKTPWCHPLLYRDEMPLSIQDAHASCALYMAKNQANAPVILRSIESRVHGLLDASPSLMTPMECLAHTQALVLYQIIRLFDGDVSARASAERTTAALESSALALRKHVGFDSHTCGAASLPLFPLAPTQAFWKDWIFQESARRTLMFTFYFTATYRILCGATGVTCHDHLSLRHASWTLSAHLWRASTPLAFAEAWRSRKHFVVTSASFVDMLEEAGADDIDEYGRIYISSYMGPDEAESWFASKGGRL